MNVRIKLKKFFRFVGMYGFLRTLFKAFGRSRFLFRLDFLFYFFPFRRGKKNVVIIGCGQHAFTSIAFFLKSLTFSRIFAVYDPDHSSMLRFKYFFSAQELLEDGYINDSLTSKADIVYIASNHATHFSYAKYYLERGLDVFVEKPLCLDFNQLEQIDHILKNTNSKLYLGYNRPFSPAISSIASSFKAHQGPFTYSANVIGHYLDANHWYRDSSEGSRVVSNLGHWLDLYVFLLFKSDRIPASITVSITQPSIGAFDNLVVSLTDSNGNLVSLTFSSRGEPFEGVSELISIQRASLISKIYDFRRMETWVDERYDHINFRGKKAGHAESVLQPFSAISRSWVEIKLSTWLMLTVEQQYLQGISSLSYSLCDHELVCNATNN
jgi:predicted dehydrogenase